MRKFTHYVKRALLDPPLTSPSPPPVPDASVLAWCGYRLFKILKTNAKDALRDHPSAFRAPERSGRFSSNCQGLKGLTPIFRAIGKRAFSTGRSSQSVYGCHFAALKAARQFGSPVSFQKLVDRSVKSSRHKSFTFTTSSCLAGLRKYPHAFPGCRHQKVFARSIVNVPTGHMHCKAPKNVIFKAFRRNCWRKAALQKVIARSRSEMQAWLPFQMVVRAFSLAFTRSHLPLGMAAIILGGHSMAQAQSHNISIQRGPPSIVLSTLFSIFELFCIMVRTLYLWILFTPVVITAPLADLFGARFRQRWLHLVHRTLESAGAAFIKWGQWAATRPDLFPRDLCTELAKLHTNAPAHKFSHTVRTIEGAFGKKLNDIFVEFAETPVASGSIAQVHKATLRNGGALGKKEPMTVAVKVRHPGVTDVIRRDFIIMNWVANLSTLVPGLKWLRLDESVRQFAVFMLTQVDLAREAAHLSRFLYNFRSWKDVSFPRPIYPLVHPAVLVESYEHGESVSNYIELPEKNQINRKLAHIGTHIFLKMLLVDNFIHADMHPGNILVRVKRQSPSNKRKGTVPRSRSQPHLVFLDVGLTAELSQKERSNLLNFFKAVALRDGRTAAQCALEFSNNQSCPNPAAFIKELETSFTFWGSKEADVIHPGECMQDLLEQVRRHRVNVAGNVCTVMVTILVLEGWQRKLDPDFNIMHTLQRLIFKQDWAESLAYTINGIMAP